MLAAPPNNPPVIVAPPAPAAPAVKASLSLAQTYVRNTFSVLASPELGWQPSVPASGTVMVSGRWARGVFVLIPRLGVGLGGGVYPYGSLTTFRVGLSAGVMFPVHRNVTLAATGGYDLHAGTDWLGGSIVAHRLSGEFTVSVQPWDHVVLDVFAQLGAFQSFQTWQPTIGAGLRIGFWWTL